MVSANYRKYIKLNRWPILKVVREKDTQNKWHIEESSLCCTVGKRIGVVSGQHNLFRIWVPKSLEKGDLYMLDPRGNEISPGDICEACAGSVMKLLRWVISDEGSLEIEQQNLRDESEERDSRAKGINE
jgi:hypothetical protein